MITPTINLNPKPCASWCPVTHTIGETTHDTHCPGKPVLVPLSLEPWRSVTLTVALGECIDARECSLRTHEGGHRIDCPARPIRVACSVSGNTWEESEVRSLSEFPDTITGATRDRLFEACRDRWALVKALVLGASKVSAFPEAFRMIPAVSEMLVQRDAVFAALADLRRTEMAAHAALLALPMDLRKSMIIAKQCGPVAADPEGGGIDLPSTKLLAVYVQRLIEQVGAL